MKVEEEHLRQAYKNLQWLFDYTLITSAGCAETSPMISELLNVIAHHLGRSVDTLDKAFPDAHYAEDVSLRSDLHDDVMEYAKTGNTLVAYAAILHMNSENEADK